MCSDCLSGNSGCYALHCTLSNSHCTQSLPSDRDSSKPAYLRRWLAWVARKLWEGGHRHPVLLHQDAVLQDQLVVHRHLLLVQVVLRRVAALTLQQRPDKSSVRSIRLPVASCDTANREMWCGHLLSKAG